MHLTHTTHTRTSHSSTLLNVTWILCHTKCMGLRLCIGVFRYGLAPTNPGRVRNIVFDGIHGIGIVHTPRLSAVAFMG